MTYQNKAGAPVTEYKIEAEGRVSGYASVFDVVDQGGDRVRPGAYAKSLSVLGRRVRMLWQHDTREVIGSWDDMQEDAKGLRISGSFNMDVQRGREAFSLMKRGDIEGLSIGYRVSPGGSKWNEETKSRDLSDLDLREVSIVTMPMCEEALAEAKAEQAVHEIKEKLAAGDRLSEREFEKWAKETLGLSNSQAERAARVHLKGPGEPAVADQMALLRALSA